MFIWLYPFYLRQQVGHQSENSGKSAARKFMSYGAKRQKANATTFKFPSEQDLNRKDRVSYEAMDLINSLLQEKEHRICSKKYSLNDYQHSKWVPGQLMAARANNHAIDYQGHYVYPDDAADIKAHPFFNGLTWDRLHLSRPPFIPDIKSCDDTKYFDEDPISDIDDSSSCYSEPDLLHDGMLDDSANSRAFDIPDFVKSLPFREVQTNKIADATPLKCNTEDVDSPDGKTKKAKEKKRPRDRMLRDKEVGRKVLELRKKGAFLGYAYRRPSVLFDQDERGRHNATRKT